MWSLPGYGLCENKNGKYGKFTCVNATRRSSLRKFEQKQLKHIILTLPGYPLCENFNKTGFLVVCSLFYLTDVMKFPIESSFPCYYGIRNERSSVFNLHNHTLPFIKQFFNLKRYILYLFN